MDEQFVVLMADDDADDRSLLKEAFKERALSVEVCFVEDGDVLLDYLYRRGEFERPEQSPRPDLILLDLNMPTDGRVALKQIKSDRELRKIPIVVFTTSSSQEDIALSYELGANAYMTKPATFKGLTELVEVLSKYWFEKVNLPSHPASEGAPNC